LPICLCFDNENSKDGIGAQVLRIIQVYCLTREYSLGFVNRDILSFDSAPTDDFDEQNPRALYYHKIRDFLNLEEDTCLKEHTIHFLENSRLLTYPIVLRLWIIQRNWKSKWQKSHELWVIKNPYGLTMRNPNVLRSFRRPGLSLEDNDKVDKNFDIQIHIRRAAISQYVHNERYTPTEWYIKILTQIIATLESNKQIYTITIHTDVGQSGLNISTSGISKESLEYSKTRGLIINDDDTITLDFENFLFSFSAFKNVSIVTDINPIDAWKIMQEADLFILARSTFSIVPALLIKDGSVISPIGFFRGPLNWIYLDDSAELSLEDIRRITEKGVIR
jgi:hypothetical protein